MTRIVLHIDRVVLEGIDLSPRHVRPFQEALHAELTRLIAAAPRATWQQSRRERRISAPQARLDTTGSPPAWGLGIARAVYGGVAQAGSRGVAR